MSDFTDWGEAQVAGFFIGNALALPDNFQVGLLEVSSDAGFVEVSWSGYARQTIARSLVAWGGTQGAGTTLASTGTSHSTSNNIALDFGTVGVGASADITYIGLFTDDSNEELFAVAELASPLLVSDGDPVSFAPGSIVFTLALAGGLSDYLANKLVDLIWRDQSYTMPPVWYATLYTAPPTNSGGGSEVAGAGYARVAVAANSAWTQTGGLLENTAPIQFAPVLADWGTVTHDGFRDAASGGNLLFWDALLAAKTIVAGGASPRYPAGNRKIEVL
jgi:hypothetical protein